MDAEREGHVEAHAELAADLDLARGPGAERADRADRDHLPEPAFHQRREPQTVLQVGRRDVDLPEVPGRTLGRSVQDQRGADQGEEDRRDAEQADVERTDPEVEEVTPEQGASTDAVFFFRS